MCSDALDSSDSDDDREQARLRLLKKKRHRMDDWLVWKSQPSLGW